MTLSLPIVLTIAGSDSGGGAGIQADLKTFQAFRTFGTTAITAVTAQNTVGVAAVHAVPPDVVRAQIAAVATDLRPTAVKTGMLGNAATVRAVAETAAEFALPNLVLDPVMVSTSGHRLLDDAGEREILHTLLPLATLVTPNLDEARILTDVEIRGEDDMRRAAEVLAARGARAVLMKGGHMSGGELVDLLFDGAEWTKWRRPRQTTRNTHGTGCTLSAAIAAELAHGRALRDAVGDALDFVQRAMRAAPGYGAGHGPLNHLVGAAPRP